MGEPHPAAARARALVRSVERTPARARRGHLRASGARRCSRAGARRHRRARPLGLQRLDPGPRGSRRRQALAERGWAVAAGERFRIRSRRPPFASRHRRWHRRRALRGLQPICSGGLRHAASGRLREPRRSSSGALRNRTSGATARTSSAARGRTRARRELRLELAAGEKLLEPQVVARPDDPSGSRAARASAARRRARRPPA